MRRKSERTATKKTKASPEKKVEKVKRTRTKRRKQSMSSENESEEGSPVREIATVEEPVKEAPTTPVKEASPEESQDQVWQVKTADASGDGGEIKKLKICLTRPPSTPERVDRSPRSKRKHSRATSSSDTPSSEGVDDKRRSRRSKKNRDSKDEFDKNHDSHDEPEVDSEKNPEKTNEEPESEISQSTEHQKACLPDETPVSTTTDDKSLEADTQAKESNNKNEQQEKSDADTTVASPKVETQNNEVNTSETQSPERRRSDSVEKSEVLELHAEVDDSKIESSEPQLSKPTDSKKEDADNSGEQDRPSSKGEVSINQDKSDESVSKEAGSTKINLSKTTNETDVVESTVKVEQKKRSKKMFTDFRKDKDMNESVERYKSKDIEHPESTEHTQDETVSNGPATPFVVNRKRKWGARPKLTTQKSITISTDVLKEIIPDVKPVEFEEVIEDKKHRRIEVIEKIERPVLPKIIIDNTENVDRKDHADMDHKVNIKKETNLAANRRISIVTENNSIIARPPSPARYKPSNILYITNLVRPFTLPQLKNLLQRTGRIVENGFWIDRIKSKCFVRYENEDQAVETRHALHGVTWPVSNPKALQVDFSTQEAFEKARLKEENDTTPISTIPGTVEDWLREQDMKRERGELQEKPWERKAAMREWDVGKTDKDKDEIKDRLRRDDRGLDKRRLRSQERSPEPARKFKKKEEEAPAKLLDDLFRKTKVTPCIYWLPLSAETIAIKEEQRRKHMEEHERRLQELRRHRERDRRH